MPDQRPSPARAKSSRFRPSGALGVSAIVGVALVLTVGGYLGVHDPSSSTSQLVGDLSLLAAAVLGTVACGRAAYRRSRHSTGWALLTLSSLLWTGAQSVYTFYGITRNHVYPFPSIADAGYLGYSIPTVAALLAFPRPPALLISRWRIGLDAAVIALGVLFASAGTVLQPLIVSTDLSTPTGLVSLAYPVVDVVICAVVLSLGMRQPSGERLRWLLLGGGLLMLAVTDSTYARLVVEGRVHLTGGVLVAGWLAAFLLVGLATLVPDRKSAGPGSSQINLALDLIPYAPVVGAVLVISVFGFERHPFLLWTGVLLGLSVTVRQVMIVFENVTLTRELERRVAARTAELAVLASIVTSSSDAIVGFSLDRTVISWNPAAERLFGLRGEDFVGGGATFLPLVQLAELGDVIDSARRRKALVSRDIDWRRPDGTTLVIALTFSPIATAEGDIQGVSIFGQDITERQQAAAALATAREEALESSRLKSEFLATMSHEIRTPMNGVIGLISLLLETSLDEVQRQYAEGVNIAGESLLTVINDILDFSKLEAGKVELEPDDFDVRTLVDEVGVLLAPLAYEKGLELLAYCLPQISASLRGDAGRIRQVLLNLASNAVKFTSTGEVSIKAWTSALDTDKVRLRVEVSDTGIGISEESRKRLFQSFSQADASTTRRYGGTGLGLAISQRLVEAMEGTIGFDSVDGTGSTFWFEIVLAHGTAAVDDRILAPDLLSGLNVLVVDDNATNRMILESQLTSWELQPELFESASSALLRVEERALEGQPYDLFVLDMCMPEMDGLELARIISADAVLPKPPVVMLTSTYHIDVAALNEAGVGAWLTKPVRSSELHERLMRLMAPPVDAPRTAPERQDSPIKAASLGRVLVVEDHAMNQFVAKGIVTKIGYQVELVTNGVEALEALSGNTSYVAVLMDCHMPVMDGFEATREIRQRQGQGPGVPIIAMTAEVMAEDRDRCFAAGMDDYISKPVTLQSVKEVLARWAKPAQEPASVPVSTSLSAVRKRPAPAVQPPIEQQQLTDLHELGSLNGSDLVARVVHLFARDSASSMVAIHQAVKAADAEDLDEALHKLLGTSANIGAKQVTALCRQLEKHAQDSDPDQTSELLGQLEAELKRANRALADALPG